MTYLLRGRHIFKWVKVIQICQIGATFFNFTFIRHNSHLTDIFDAIIKRLAGSILQSRALTLLHIEYPLKIPHCYLGQVTPHRYQVTGH